MRQRQDAGDRQERHHRARRRTVRRERCAGRGRRRTALVPAAGAGRDGMAASPSGSDGSVRIRCGGCTWTRCRGSRARRCASRRPTRSRSRALRCLRQHRCSGPGWTPPSATSPTRPRRACPVRGPTRCARRSAAARSRSATSSTRRSRGPTSVRPTTPAGGVLPGSSSGCCSWSTLGGGLWLAALLVSGSPAAGGPAAAGVERDPVRQDHADRWARPGSRASRSPAGSSPPAEPPAAPGWWPRLSATELEKVADSHVVAPAREELDGLHHLPRQPGHRPRLTRKQSAPAGGSSGAWPWIATAGVAADVTCRVGQTSAPGAYWAMETLAASARSSSEVVPEARTASIQARTDCSLYLMTSGESAISTGSLSSASSPST